MSGGTGSASTAGLDVTTTKDSYIPLFSGAPSDYKEWRKRLTIYVMKMRMAKKEAEGLLSVIGSLTGTAWRLLENFPIEDIEKAGAFEKMLKILDKAFEYDKSVQLPTDFDKYFTGLHRHPGQSLLEYTTEHDHLYNKLSDHDVTLPGKVQGWHLLRRAGLTREQRQLVTAQAPTLERNKVQEAMFLLLGQDHKTVAGGGQHQHHRGFRGKGRAYAAYYEDDDNDLEPDDWLDDDGREEGYYEWDDTQSHATSPVGDNHGDETFEDFDNDAAYYQTLDDVDPAEQAEEFDTAYATYLDARKRFNEIKLSRGYLPIVALTDGNLSPGAASPHSSGSPVSPGRGKGKTKKGKGGSNTIRYPPRGKGKEPDPKGRAKASSGPPTCLRCGQVGHMTYNCPVPKGGATKRKTAPTESTVDHSEHGHVIFIQIFEATNDMTVPCWTQEPVHFFLAMALSCATCSSSRRPTTTSPRSSSCDANEPSFSEVMPV